MVIHSGHGEFARLVVSLSDHETIFERIGEAFDMAEKFQIPVIVLSEKAIAESRVVLDMQKFRSVPINRYLEQDLDSLESKDRFKLTDDGISKRWIPGSCDTYYYANGDEHREDGTLTEDAVEIGEMQDKRLRKIETLEQAIPEPRLF